MRIHYNSRIAYAERRFALGIEIVLTNPTSYFAHRRSAIGGMASFDIAKNTLTTIGLDCPIWLIGIIQCNLIRKEGLKCQI